MCGFKKSRFDESMIDSFGAGILGDGLCTFTDGMLCKFTRKQKTHGGLNFPWWNRLFPVLRTKSWGFRGDSFKDIINKRVHDTHAVPRYANIGMNLFEYIVDVSAIALLSSSCPLRWLSASLLSPFLWAFLRAFLRTLCRTPLSWTCLATGTHGQNYYWTLRK